ncbi:MAG TPA: TRAP transporter small permease, partial [Maritimibacter sp.]|nr:TRAP transporter small permease [Maritimibacter sp.]
MDSTPAPRPVRRIIQIIERIAGIVLGLVTILIVASAIGRYGFARPIPDAFDVSRLVLGVAIAWGMASVGYHGSHIKVDLLAQVVG